MVNNVVRGRLPVSEEDALYLAGLQLQYEVGSYDPNYNLEYADVSFVLYMCGYTCNC